MSKRPRRSFTAEFKKEAVALVGQDGKTVGGVAQDLDLTDSALRSWVKKAASAGARSITGDERGELLRLRTEVAHLRMERDFLKKAAAFFARESR